MTETPGHAPYIQQLNARIGEGRVWRDITENTTHLDNETEVPE